MSKSIRLRQLCNGKSADKVDNRLYMQSLDKMQCLSGFQTVKAKYAQDAKPFFSAKSKFDISAKYEKVEVSAPAATGAPPPQPAANQPP